MARAMDSGISRATLLAGTTVPRSWVAHNPDNNTRRLHLSAPGGRTRRLRHPAAPTRARWSWGQCARRAAGWAGSESATARICPSAATRPPPPLPLLPRPLPPPAAWCEQRSLIATRRGAQRSSGYGLQPRLGPLRPSTRLPPRRSGQAWPNSSRARPDGMFARLRFFPSFFLVGRFFFLVARLFFLAPGGLLVMFHIADPTAADSADGNL